jgi:hypothetical protein
MGKRKAVTLDDVRALVLQRDGYCYQYCGSTQAPRYIYEHVIPQAWGGPFASYNIVMACVGCNVSKGSTVRLPLNMAALAVDNPAWARQIQEHATPWPDRVIASYKIDAQVKQDFARYVKRFNRDKEPNEETEIGAVAEQALAEYMQRHPAEG